MRVADLLSSKGHEVYSIDRHRSIADAVSSLREHGIGALIVTGGGAPYAGIVSERDVVRGLAQEGANVLTTAIENLMSTDVVTCEPATTMAELMILMTENRIRHVPVVHEGRLAGMISIEIGRAHV